MQGIAATAIFFVGVLVWRSIYVKHGNIGFWQLAADQPDAAYQWMTGRPDWIVLHPQDPRVEQLKQSPDLVGPFRLAVPSVGGMVVIFSESGSIDGSQREFIELHGGSREKAIFPWLSWLAMLYLYCFRPVKQKKVLVWDLPNRSLEARFDSLLLLAL